MFGVYVKAIFGRSHQLLICLTDMFYILQLYIFILLYMKWNLAVLYSLLFIINIYIIIYNNVPHFKSTIYVVVFWILAHKNNKNNYKNKGTRRTLIYVASCKNEGQNRRSHRGQEERSVSFSREGRRLLCLFWWGVKALSKSAPHTFFVTWLPFLKCLW